MKSIRGIIGVMFAILAMAGITGFPNSVHAQAGAGGEFRLSQSVHRGNAILPSGKYMYSVESGSGPTVIRVSQIGGNFTGLFLPQTFSQGGDSNSRGIVLARIGEETFVTSLHLEERGLVLNFFAPNAEMGVSRQDTTRARYTSVSKSPTQGFFRVLNPGNEKMTYVEVEKVYLAACETVEREFNRSTPIRPRLTLYLGAGQNPLRYPNREILLTKWDKYRFADAVVDLALRDMVSPEDRLRLGNLAVTEAGGTVSVCELKNCTN